MVEKKVRVRFAPSPTVPLFIIICSLAKTEENSFFA